MREIKARIEEDTPVDTGKLKNGWRMEETESGARLFNETEYAAAVERERGMLSRNTTPRQTAALIKKHLT